MAQLRQGYDGFVERGAEIVVVGPDNRQAFSNYWKENQLPFVGLLEELNRGGAPYPG